MIGFLSTANTYLAPRYSCPQTSSFEGLGGGVGELVSLLDSSEPEGVFVGEIVARATGTIALDERRGAEVLQAGTRRRQRLSAALRTGRSVHGKTVADPERGPASWAVGDRDALTMHGDDVGGDFTDDAS